MSRRIPRPPSSTVVTFDILSDGSEVSGRFEILSIVVEQAVNRLSSATLILRDGDAASQSFPGSEAEDFVPGKKISIRLGYGSNNDLVFEGKVVSQAIKIREQRAILEVSCRHAAFVMALAPRGRYFKDMSDWDALSSIVEANGLLIEGEDNGTIHKQQCQYNCTDWDYVLTKADALGHIVLPIKDGLKIAPPNLSGEPILRLEYGATILRMDIEMDARNQFKSVEGSQWDLANQARESSQADRFEAPNMGNMSAEDLAETHGIDPLPQRHGGSIGTQSLESWTNARLAKSRLARFRGSVRFQGYAAMQADQLVELGGLGARFNGTAYVSAVRHELAAGNWTSDIELGLDDSWFVERFEVNQIANGGLTPAATALQIGIVTAIENDPDGEDSIQVKLPLVEENGEGLWARLLSLMAGGERGFVFRPDIGDEVMVGFLDGDPKQPVILGGVHSSAQPSPIAASDDNHHKGFFSRSGIKLLFDDDKKELQLASPQGNSLLISDDKQGIIIADQHGNEITLDRQGITIKSAKDIKIQAASQLKMDGLDASLNSLGGVDVSAASILNLQGSLVTIN